MLKTSLIAAVFSAVAFSSIAAAAAAPEPADLVFTQNTDGKYIYCNNHELIRSIDLADNSNMSPRYIMNNENLTPDKYALFASFSNRTDIDTNTNLTSYTASKRGFDIEVDVMFRAEEDTVITLERLGFEVPEQRSFILNDTQYQTEDEWGCFYCWSEYLGMPIKQINSGNSYSKEPIEETQFTVEAGETVWLSQFIDDYREVPFCRSVNIMADFTIESGECDVNILAVRSNGNLKDRSNVNKNPAYGSYYRDKQYKGISDGLNEVTAELSYTIDDSTPGSINMPVTVYNQSMPDGNTIEKWYTHLNPRADEWSYDLCAESDMLSFRYDDPYKTTYYGSDIPAQERDTTYIFDTHHADTSVYDKSYGNKNSYIPNRELTDEDGTDIACNLGNYGVIYNYKISVTNNGNKQRYLTYCLATSSNNVVYLKDSDGNVINGYALCKGTRTERVSDNMACMTIPAQSTAQYTVCVILTPNYAGGIENYLRLTDYPQIIEIYETERSGIEKDRYFTGREYYKWDKNELYISDDRENWRKIYLPSTVLNGIAGNVNEYSLTYTGNGYLLRPALYDGGVYSHADFLYRTVYLLNEDFSLIASNTFGSYPQAASVANGVYYVKMSGTVFRSEGFKWWDMVYTQMPCWNYGRFSALLDNDSILLSTDGINFSKVTYTGFKPDYIDSYGDLYYFSDGRALYLSENGLYWNGVMASQKITSFECSGDSLIINGSERVDMPVLYDGTAVKYNDSYISFDNVPFIENDLTYVPLRTIADVMGCETTWEDGTITVSRKNSSITIEPGNSTAVLNGTETEIPPVIIKDDISYIPIRTLAESLGAEVDYDADTNTALIAEK